MANADMLEGMEKYSPFGNEDEAREHGRKGHASLEGETHGIRQDTQRRCGGTFHLLKGAIEFKGRGIVRGVFYNACDKCGEPAVRDEEWDYLREREQWSE